METTKLDNKQTGKQGKGTKNMKTASAMAGASILGAATATAAEEIMHSSNDLYEAEPVDAPQETEVEAVAETEQETVDTDVTQEQIAESSVPESPSEPEPIVNGEHESAHTSDHGNTPTPDSTTYIPEPPVMPNPGEDVVSRIVEEIDPDDIDAPDIFTIDDIGTIHTIDGEEMLAAAIHDMDDNKLLMVDVDGDQVFDVFVTYEGDVIAEVPGNIDVSDAEHMASMATGDAGYLAATTYDNNIDTGSEIQEDIIDTIA